MTVGGGTHLRVPDHVDDADVATMSSSRRDASKSAKVRRRASAPAGAASTVPRVEGIADARVENRNDRAGPREVTPRAGLAHDLDARRMRPSTPTQG